MADSTPESSRSSFLAAAASVAARAQPESPAGRFVPPDRATPNGTVPGYPEGVSSPQSAVPHAVSAVQRLSSFFSSAAETAHMSQAGKFPDAAQQAADRGQSAASFIAAKSAQRIHELESELRRQKEQQIAATEFGVAKAEARAKEELDALRTEVHSFRTKLAEATKAHEEAQRLEAEALKASESIVAGKSRCNELEQTQAAQADELQTLRAMQSTGASWLQGNAVKASEPVAAEKARSRDELEKLQAAHAKETHGLEAEFAKLHEETQRLEAEAAQASESMAAQESRCDELEELLAAQADHLEELRTTQADEASRLEGDAFQARDLVEAEKASGRAELEKLRAAHAGETQCLEDECSKLYEQTQRLEAEALQASESVAAQESRCDELEKLQAAQAGEFAKLQSMQAEEASRLEGDAVQASDIVAAEKARSRDELAKLQSAHAVETQRLQAEAAEAWRLVHEETQRLEAEAAKASASIAAFFESRCDELEKLQAAQIDEVEQLRASQAEEASRRFLEGDAARAGDSSQPNSPGRTKLSTFLATEKARTARMKDEFDKLHAAHAEESQRLEAEAAKAHEETQRWQAEAAKASESLAAEKSRCEELEKLRAMQAEELSRMEAEAAKASDSAAVEKARNEDQLANLHAAHAEEIQKFAAEASEAYDENQRLQASAARASESLASRNSRCYELETSQAAQADELVELRATLTTEEPSKMEGDTVILFAHEDTRTSRFEDEPTTRDEELEKLQHLRISASGGSPVKAPAAEAKNRKKGFASKMQSCLCGGKAKVRD